MPGWNPPRGNGPCVVRSGNGNTHFRKEGEQQRANRNRSRIAVFRHTTRMTVVRGAMLLLLLLLLLFVCCCCLLRSNNVQARSFPGTCSRPAFRRIHNNRHLLPLRSILLRGGATVSVDDEDEQVEVVDLEEEDDTDDNDNEQQQQPRQAEEEPKEEEKEAKPTMDAKLAVATVKSIQKSRNKLTKSKITTAKNVVNSNLADITKKQPLHTNGAAASNQQRREIRLPYILRACLSPFCIFAMTKAYWASLFNLDFNLGETTTDASQELRSALEEKAKRNNNNNNSNRRGGRRTMKRGQAKTLSDLPALNT
jgi:hypothetical protein